MSSVYRVIKKQVKELITNTCQQKYTIEIPMSSIDLDYSTIGCTEYISKYFIDFKVKLKSPSTIVLKRKRHDGQDSLQTQTEKLLHQFPKVKTVEYIKVGNEYKPKKRKK